MDSIWWANLTASSIIVVPLLVTLVNAVRGRRDVQEVKALVNGHSSRQEALIATLHDEVRSLRGDPPVGTAS